MNLRAFAARHGYLYQRQPEALAGEGEDAYGIPLAFGRGWIWNAGASLGLHFTSSPHRGGLKALAKRLAEAGIGWREQTLAADGLLGWVSPDGWGRAAEAVACPTKERRTNPLARPLRRRAAKYPQEMASATR